MSRPSRKQMKRNEMAETVGSVVEYTRDHTRTLVWAVVALFAVLALLAGYFAWRSHRGAAATGALAAAMAVEDDDAAAREKFQEVVERFPGSAAANVARLYLGDAAAAASDAETARELWRSVARESGDTAVGQQALLNLWQLERSQGRHDELAAEIRSLLDEETATLGKDQLLYELALTLEASGSDVEARDTYLRLVDEYPQSVLIAAAQERADRLGGATTG